MNNSPKPHETLHQSKSEVLRKNPLPYTVRKGEFFKQDHGVTVSCAMAPASLADLVSALPSDESWGPPTATETTLDGVPYAPYSKGDKLGRMADWTLEGKDGRDGRGGRQQYNRNYRGRAFPMGFIGCS